MRAQSSSELEVADFARSRTIQYLLPMRAEATAASSTLGEPFEVAAPGGILRGRMHWGPEPVAFVGVHGLLHSQADLAQRAIALAALGWSTLTYDLRGHGESDAKLEPKNLVAQHVGDLSQIVSSVSGLVGHSVVPITLGLSFSAWTVLDHATRVSRDVVGGVICDSGPAQSAPHMIGRLVAAAARSADDDRLRSCSSRAGALATAFAADLLNQGAIWPPRPPRSGIPSLFLVGQRDRVIPAKETQSVAESLGPAAEIEYFERASHGRTWATEPERYIGLLGKFTERVQHAD